MTRVFVSHKRLRRVRPLAEQNHVAHDELENMWLTVHAELSVLTPDISSFLI
jgi:hypothetical protein